MKIEERRLRVRDDSSQMSGKYLMVNEWKGKGWFRAPGKGYHKKVYQQVALLTEDRGGWTWKEVNMLGLGWTLEGDTCTGFGIYIGFLWLCHFILGFLLGFRWNMGYLIWGHIWEPIRDTIFDLIWELTWTLIWDLIEQKRLLVEGKFLKLQICKSNSSWCFEVLYYVEVLLNFEELFHFEVLFYFAHFPVRTKSYSHMLTLSKGFPLEPLCFSWGLKKFLLPEEYFVPAAALLLPLLFPLLLLPGENFLAAAVLLLPLLLLSSSSSTALLIELGVFLCGKCSWTRISIVIIVKMILDKTMAIFYKCCPGGFSTHQNEAIWWQYTKLRSHKMLKVSTLPQSINSSHQSQFSLYQFFTSECSLVFDLSEAGTPYTGSPCNM